MRNTEPSSGVLSPQGELPSASMKSPARRQKRLSCATLLLIAYATSFLTVHTGLAEERHAYWSHLVPKSTWIDPGSPRGKNLLTNAIIADRLHHIETLGVGGIRVAGTSPAHVQMIRQAYQLPNRVRTCYRVDPRFGSVPNDTYWAGSWAGGTKTPVADFIWNNRLQNEIQYVSGLNEFYLEVKGAYDRKALPEYWRYPSDYGKKDNAIRLKNKNGPERFWATFVADYTRDTWAAMRPSDNSERSTALRKVKVVGPSPAPPYVVTEWGKHVPDLSAWMDYGNIHPYTPNNRADAASGFHDAITHGLDRPRINRYFGNLPLVATELGNATPGGQSGAGNKPLGLRWAQQAKLILRQIVQAFELTLPQANRQNKDGPNRVVAMSQFYTLYDSGKPWGWVARPENLDGPAELKDAYFAVANLLGLFRDNGTEDFKPASLDYSFRGAPDNFRSALFQKSNGDFYLAYWRNDQAWDNDTGSDPGGDNDAPVWLRVNTPGPYEFLHLDPHVRSFWDPKSPAGEQRSSDSVGEIALIAKDKVQLLRIRQVRSIDAPAVMAASADADCAAAVYQRMTPGIQVGYFNHDQDKEPVAAVNAEYLDSVRAAGFKSIRFFFETDKTPAFYAPNILYALKNGLVVNLCMFAWDYNAKTKEAFVNHWRSRG